MSREKGTDLSVHRTESWAPANGQAARWLAFHLEVRAPHTWFGPTWAFLGGVVSCGQAPTGIRSLVLVLIGWLVCEPLLGSLLALSGEIAALRQAGRRDPVVVRRWTLPYVQTGTPGQRVLDGLARAAALSGHGWRVAGEAGERWFFLAAITLLLSLAAGMTVVPLVAAMVLLSFLVAALRPLPGPLRVAAGALQFLTAWLAGRAALGALDARVLAAGVGLALVWFAWTQRPPRALWLALGELLTAGLLIAWRAPIAGVGMLLMAAPLFALWPDGPTSQRSYLASTQVFLMVALLLVAGGLAWIF